MSDKKPRRSVIIGDGVYRSAPRGASVVHPEPGDRAERWRAHVTLDESGQVFLPHLMALADVEVAAAVAAVRADLAAQIEADAERAESGSGRDFADGERRAAALVRGTAAAVRSATRETK